MGGRRSVPGVQASFLDAEARTCPICKGAKRVRKPPRVRLDVTPDQATALLAGDRGERRRVEQAIRLAESKAEAMPYVTCPTCGGTGQVTLLPLY